MSLACNPKKKRKIGPSVYGLMIGPNGQMVQPEEDQVRIITMWAGNSHPLTARDDRNRSYDSYLQNYP